VNNKQRQGVRDSIDAIVNKSGIDFVQNYVAWLIAMRPLKRKYGLGEQQ